MEDSRIISLFFERSDNAIAELSKKYGKLFLHISGNVLDDKRDAEECVNEAYHETWKTIPPENPSSLLAYVGRIVRNISIDRFRHNCAEKRNGGGDICLDEIEELLSDNGGIDDGTPDDIITGVIDDYIASLDDTDRVIIVRRYWHLDSYDEIADITKLKKSAVYMRMSRIKSGLKTALAERGLIK
ncbi:MAG: sigma-70 family RNA polymerase sigma factor [Firmicutes bacterium]|nr:sigma-70 family RNA polymerase sigma factor [Candidatus Colimorpha enterica]